jgi:von Willebrand factor type A C-terminal domain/von Willebrand factor type A domain
MDASEQKLSTDQGTATGAPTRLLTRVIAALLVALAATGTLVRRVAAIPFRLVTGVARFTRRRRRLLAALGVIVVAMVLVLGAVWVAIFFSQAIATVGVAIATLAAVGAAAFIATAACVVAGWIVAKAAGVAWSCLRPLGRALVVGAVRASRPAARAGRRTVFAVGVAFVKARAETSARRTPASPPQPGGGPRRSSVTFDAAVNQNCFLAPDAQQVQAVITVTAKGDGDHGKENGVPERAEVILLDCSGSMGKPWAKLRAARHATEAALDALPDGAWFAVVRGNHRAEVVYPLGGDLAPATAENRRAAKLALKLLWPEGGTAMGHWLLLARDLVAFRPRAIAHAILLTDGRNESESPDALQAALAACANKFQCDCRGVGTDWELAELREIGSGMLGSVDIVPEPVELDAHFRAMTEAAMARRVDRVSLEVWVPRGATVRFVRQVAPVLEDLVDHRLVADEHTMRYPTGAWSSEARDYHLCIDVPPQVPGSEMLAARVSVLVDGRAVAEAVVKATWTDDGSLSSKENPAVAHYERQAEIVDSIRRGLDAREAGDELAANGELGRATQIAAATGHEAALQLLAAVVDVEDAITGVVRFKGRLEKADEMALATRSTKTLRLAQPRSEEHGQDR